MKRRSGAKRNHQTRGRRVPLVGKAFQRHVLDSYDYIPPHHYRLTHLREQREKQKKGAAKPGHHHPALNFPDQQRNLCLLLFLSLYDSQPYLFLLSSPLSSAAYLSVSWLPIHLNSPCITSVKHFRSQKECTTRGIVSLSFSRTGTRTHANTHAHTIDRVASTSGTTTELRQLTRLLSRGITYPGLDNTLRQHLFARFTGSTAPTTLEPWRSNNSGCHIHRRFG